MKNVFKYIVVAADFLARIITGIVSNRKAKKANCETLDKLVSIYADNGFPLTESLKELLRKKADSVAHYVQVIRDYYAGQRSTDDWFVRRFAHFANLDLTLSTFLAAQIAIENFDEAVYRYLEDMEEHQEEFDKISQL